MSVWMTIWFDAQASWRDRRSAQPETELQGLNSVHCCGGELPVNLAEPEFVNGSNLVAEDYAVLAEAALSATYCHI
jgi:hypothetical protein